MLVFQEIPVSTSGNSFWDVCFVFWPKDHLCVPSFQYDLILVVSGCLVEREVSRAVKHVNEQVDQ